MYLRMTFYLMISFNEIISDNYIDFSNTYKKLNEEDLKSFRYFENRGLDYVLGIFKPELVYFNLEPFGYYHLDIEDDMINEAEDTLTILSKYVNSLNIDNKKELDNLLISLYNESLTLETV